MAWNEEQQRQARLMSSGSWPKREARKTTFRDVLRALGIASSPLDLTSQEPEGVRPDYGLTGAGLERRRRYPGEYFPGEATQADVAGALWNIVESAGVENLPGIGPHKTEQRAPGSRRYIDLKGVAGNGAEVVGYEWRSKTGEDTNSGRPKTVSDWDNSDISTGTGRGIVHVFHVRHPDGAITPEGIGSASKLLGLSTSKLNSTAKSAQESMRQRERYFRSEVRHNSFDTVDAARADTKYPGVIYVKKSGDSTKVVKWPEANHGIGWQKALADDGWDRAN